jgi:hypothetical protein
MPYRRRQPHCWRTNPRYRDSNDVIIDRDPCLWRIPDFRLKSTISTGLILETRFPTLLRHEGSAGTHRPSIDHHRQTPGTRRRAPDLAVQDRFLVGFWSLFPSPRRVQRAAVILQPSPILRFHRLLKQRKYRQLYSAEHKQAFIGDRWTHYLPRGLCSQPANP